MKSGQGLWKEEQESERFMTKRMAPCAAACRHRSSHDSAHRERRTQSGAKVTVPRMAVTSRLPSTSRPAAHCLQ